jgi:hypothetical protein
MRRDAGLPNVIRPRVRTSTAIDVVSLDSGHLAVVATSAVRENEGNYQCTYRFCMRQPEGFLPGMY